MNVILILVFFLSLTFLAMIFGERLSLFGFVDGRWLTAPFDMLARFWDLVCEATDRIWCFVFDHFWWVAATASGSIGIVLVALIMVSGLSNEAEAVRREEQTIMPVGSVLDHTTVIDAGNVLLTNAVSTSDDVSQLIYQTRSFAERPLLPEYTPRVDYVPPPPPPPNRDWSYSRSRLTLTMEPLERDGGRFEQMGRRVRSLDVDRLIERAVSDLRQDDWLISNPRRRPATSIASRPRLTEDPAFAVEDLAARVRVVPGDVVSATNLKVEKFSPPSSGPGDFEIQIRLTNLGRDSLSGVIVRELLPAAWEPKDMQPRGVFRDATVTWLVNDLAPFQDQVLTLQVESGESGRFQSLTEVSATTAVANEANITRKSRPLPPVAAPIRSTSKLPKLRLVLESEPAPVNVGEWATANFRVENIGDVPAIGVSLFVTLAAGLDHHALHDDDLKREVDWKLRRLDPGGSRQMPLVVRPTFRGRHFSTAELRLQKQQLSVKPFEIIGIDVAEGRPAPSPVPAFP